MTCYDLSYDYSFDSLDSFDYLSESQVSTAATSPGFDGFNHNYLPNGAVPNGAVHKEYVQKEYLPNEVVQKGYVPNEVGQNGKSVTPATPLQTPRQSDMITPATIMSRCYSTSSTPFVGMKLNFETPVSDTASEALLTPQSISMDRSHSLPESGVNPFYAPFELNDVSDCSSPSDTSSESGLAPPLFTNPFYKPQTFVQPAVKPVVQPSPSPSPSTSPVEESVGAKAAKLALSLVDESKNSLFKSPEVQNLYSIIHTPHTPTVVPHNGVLSVSPEFEFTVCEKKFVCKHCDKRFKRHEHLKRHMKIHTDDRPFCCDIEGCGRKFSRSDNFRAHRRTHMKKGGRNSFVEGLQDQYTHRQKRRC